MSPAEQSTDLLRIDGASLLQRIQFIASAGTTRLAYSKEDLKGRTVVKQMMREVGLEVSTDTAGNIIGRRRGRRKLPSLMFGSHIDTVRNGGRYDGILGVMAAIECIRVLHQLKRVTEHPLEVIVFANEEGQLFGALCGSRAMAGLLQADELQRKDGSSRTLGEAIADAGGDPAKLSAAARKKKGCGGFR